MQKNFLLEESQQLASFFVDWQTSQTLLGVFLHCGKALLRSGLWKPETWPDARPIPTLYEMIEDQTGLDCEIKKEDDILAMYQKELYQNK